MTVLGATGKVGRRLVAALVEKDYPVTAVGRDPEKLAGITEVIEKRAADASDPRALAVALEDADTVVSCLHARFAGSVLEAAPAGVRRIILMGSTRMYTMFPDRAAEEVRRANRLAEESMLPCVIVHPTMIYGDGAENNIRRMAFHIERHRTVPLPYGGRSLIQPVHINDVVSSLLALAEMESDPPFRSIVAAGPRAMTYAETVESIAKALDRKVRVISVPGWLLMLCAPLTRLIPGVPVIHRGEVRRLMENKNFDITAMRRFLGVDPVPFEEGLAMSLSRE